MARKPDRYIAIPMDIVQSDLSIGAKMLYGLIRSLSAKEGYCWASNEALGDDLNADPRTIRRWLGELEAEGLITRTGGRLREISIVSQDELKSKEEDAEGENQSPKADKSVHPSGHKCTSDMDKSVHPLGQNCPPKRTEMSTHPDKSVHVTRTNLSTPFIYNNQTNNQTNNQREYNPPTPLKGGGGGNDPLEVVLVEDNSEHLSDGWEEFWEEYPNKDGSHWAKAWWQKTKPDSKTRTEILDGLKQHKRQPKWLASGGAYIPTASTWLKSRDWLRPPDMTPRTNAQGGKKISRGRRISYERTYSAEQISALFAPIREQVADVN